MKKILFILVILPTLVFSQCWQYVDVGANHTLAIRNDGTLWSWGSNNYIKLGYATSSGINPNPKMVGTSTNWHSVSAGEWHSAGIKTDGTLWTWGANYYGQVGQGTSGIQFASVSTPTQVGSDTNWQSVSIGVDYTLAIKNDGTLWGIGLNTSGQLGIGNTSNVSLPIQIGTSNIWKKVSGNSGYSIGLKTDGTLWSWGSGYLGNVGYGTSNIPIQIGNETNWFEISSSGTFAIKNDNSLWTWGVNSSGQLGDGTYITRETPIQVGTDTNWLKVSSYYDHTLGIKTNNTLWVWGINNYGQLGDGTFISKISPIQIETETNWISTTTGEYFSIAIKSDGKLFSWGRNYDGRLGNGTTIDLNIPTQVICTALNSNSFIDKSFSIYPNPTNEILFIENNLYIPIDKIVLTDLSGKIILEEKGNFSEINIGNIESGIYILNINSENKVYNYKIVKK